MRMWAVLAGVMLVGAGAAATSVRLVSWSDLPPAIQQRLTAGGLSEAVLPAFLDRERADTDRRMRDGNFDHLVYFALQSTHFTPLPPIEPALSARTFAETLRRARVPDDAAARLDALASALVVQNQREDARLTLFRDVISHEDAGLASSVDALRERLRKEYARAMAFLYEKEFVATRDVSDGGRAATAALYQSRSHSTDTQIEAGYGVSVALATLKALVPGQRIARVLIVGPGLDLAPRTGLLEGASPQSYQPFAVADALLALRLSGSSGGGALRIDLADINPLVIRHFARLAATGTPVRLDVASGLADDDRTRLSDDYRAYVQQWGRAIAMSWATGGGTHLSKTVLVDASFARVMHAERFNVITDRFADARRYDLIVITNVLPYFNDRELLLALANIASLLASGGAFIHNEPRPALLAASAAIGMPAVQSRTVLLASPPAGQPLHDTVILHRKD